MSIGFPIDITTPGITPSLSVSWKSSICHIIHHHTDYLNPKWRVLNTILNTETMMIAVPVSTISVNENGIPNIVQELLDKKAKEDNTIDLNAYGNGLIDLFYKIFPQQKEEV
jgi:hypothetical protein